MIKVNANVRPIKVKARYYRYFKGLGETAESGIKLPVNNSDTFLAARCQIHANSRKLATVGAAIEAARRVKPDLSLSVIRRLIPHFHPDYLDRRLDALRKAGLPE